jgi:hypothetical protein
MVDNCCLPTVEPSKYAIRELIAEIYKRKLQIKTFINLYIATNSQ